MKSHDCSTTLCKFNSDTSLHIFSISSLPPVASLSLLSCPAVVQVNVLDMETVANWAKFTVNILSVYKCRDERVKRGDNFLWIHMKDLACKCPKIQISRKYLVMGISENPTDRPGLMADKNSLVIQWRDAWTRRLRKLQRREKKGKCLKP